MMKMPEKPAEEKKIGPYHRHIIFSGVNVVGSLFSFKKTGNEEMK